MIRSMESALLVAGMGILLAGTVARAEPSGKCGGGSLAFSSTGGSICSTTGPYKGSLEVRSTGGTNGYAVLDGDSTNQSLPSNALDGYAGVQSGGGYQGPVFSSDGDYAFGPQPSPQPPPPPPLPSLVAVCCESEDPPGVPNCAAESPESIASCLTNGRRLCAPSSCLPDGTCSVGTATICVPPTCCQIGNSCEQEDAAQCLLEGGSVVPNSVCDLQTGACS